MRPGHHRPLGTTTWMRFTGWTQERAPELGDVAVQTSGPGADDAHLYLRAYRVAGIEEGRLPTSYRLLMERISWDEVATPTGEMWAFYHLPRR